MLVDNQLIEVKWGKRNKRWYESQGIQFTNFGDRFYVTPYQLPKGSKALVNFMCDYCQKTFPVKLQNYFRHQKLCFGEYKCAECYRKHINEFSLNVRQNKIYNKIKEQCVKFGYELITSKGNINNVDSLIEYKCKLHGNQKRRAHLFMYGDHICPECNVENKKLTVDEVVKRIECRGAVLTNKDDYIDTTTKNLQISCTNCNKIFITSFNSFYYTRYGNAQCCPECSKSESAGERKIKMFLEDNNIDYIYQKSFDDCRDKNMLPFDFYLPDYNMCIEYDGEQHFQPVAFKGCSEQEKNKSFELVQMHDNIKNQYCKDNDIRIVRIPYYDYDNIENIIVTHLNKSHEDIV